MCCRFDAFVHLFLQLCGSNCISHGLRSILGSFNVLQINVALVDMLGQVMNFDVDVFAFPGFTFMFGCLYSRRAVHRYDFRGYCRLHAFC